MMRTNPCSKCGATDFGVYVTKDVLRDGSPRIKFWCRECNRRKCFSRSRARLTNPTPRSRLLPHEQKSHSYEWNLQNPEKRKAQKAVEVAVRQGKLIKQPCERCGSENVHAHHDDYSKPLEIMWLCPKHHKERHRELLCREAA